MVPLDALDETVRNIECIDRAMSSVAPGGREGNDHLLETLVPHLVASAAAFFERRLEHSRRFLIPSDAHAPHDSLLRALYDALPRLPYSEGDGVLHSTVGACFAITCAILVRDLMSSLSAEIGRLSFRDSVQLTVRLCHFEDRVRVSSTCDARARRVNAFFMGRSHAPSDGGCSGVSLQEITHGWRAMLAQALSLLAKLPTWPAVTVPDRRWLCRVSTVDYFIGMHAVIDCMRPALQCSPDTIEEFICAGVSHLFVGLSGALCERTRGPGTLKLSREAIILLNDIEFLRSEAVAAYESVAGSSSFDRLKMLLYFSMDMSHGQIIDRIISSGAFRAVAFVEHVGNLLRQHGDNANAPGDGSALSERLVHAVIGLVGEHLGAVALKRLLERVLESSAATVEAEFMSSVRSFRGGTPHLTAMADTAISILDDIDSRLTRFARRRRVVLKGVGNSRGLSSCSRCFRERASKLITVAPSGADSDS